MLLNPTVGVWTAQNKVLCLDQICWSASLLGKHDFLMAKIKPLLPNELEGECVVKNRRHCGVREHGGRIEIRGRREREGGAGTVEKKEIT